MKIAVCGIWHLGAVTAACLAEAGFDVVGYDPDPNNIANLKAGKAPIFEPNLDKTIQSFLQQNLHFTTDLKDIHDADIVWITYDTPVDDLDKADVDYVVTQIKTIMEHVPNQGLLLISSQLPVGTTKKLIDDLSARLPHKNIHAAYSPENLRLGNAIHIFKNQERIVVGLQHQQDKLKLEQLLKPFTQNILWMSIASAEMSKHAVNAFLASSVIFINELAALCEQTGADAHDLERSLKTEDRIGPKAYVRAGHAIAGGTLARDVNYLIDIGREHGVETPFFSGLLRSNQAHKRWTARRMLEKFQSLANKTVTALGLAYKPGTSALRRSHALELCEFLSAQGAMVNAFDPAITELPTDLQEKISLKASIQQALEQSDAIVINTECPEFKTLNVELLLTTVRTPIVFDPAGFLRSNLGQDKRVQYYSVGSSI